MPREPIPGGLMCSRGGRRTKCATPGCSGRADFLCDFPLAGKRAGKTCSRAMCERCRRAQSPGVDYCEPHARQTSFATAAPETWK